ncbi:MAG: two-component hybrid sensor and regulator [Acidobacteria bacterium]|nr:two-component hybrid sensor and regulator [Acidobacteriota bacterium]
MAHLSLRVRCLAGVVGPSLLLGAAAGWSRHPVGLVAAAVGSLALGALFVGRLSQRIGSATEAARRLGQGDLSATMPVEGSTDLRALARALNSVGAASARRDDQLNHALENAANQRDRFHSILNASNDGLLLYDADRHLVAVNQRCGELLGFSVHELLSGNVGVLQRSLEQRSEEPEAYRDRLERHFARPLEPHQDLLVLSAPRRRVIRRYSCPVVNQRGLQGRVFTYTDVTTESDIDRLKSEFVSMTSHELRTPLTSVHGALQLALSGSGDRLAEEDRELLEISLANTERLVRLVNDLLDLSKIEAGRMPFCLAPMALAPLLDEAVRVIQGLAATRGVQVRLDVAPDLGGVSGDHDHLLRVLTNLLGNAIKYSPPGSVVVLEARPTPEGAVVAVLDQGPGIPHDQVDRLFRPFSRLGVHERQTSGGTGLGLAISRALIEQHGGRIWFERTPAGGSQFAFVLPSPSATHKAGSDLAVA